MHESVNLSFVNISVGETGENFTTIIWIPRQNQRDVEFAVHLMSKTDKGQWHDVGKASSGQGSYSIPDLQPGKQYRVRLVKVHRTGDVQIIWESDVETSGVASFQYIRVMDCKLHISLVLTWDPDDSGVTNSMASRGAPPPPIQHCQLNLVRLQGLRPPVSMSALPHDSAASAPPDLSQGQGQNYNINYYKLYADSVICHLKLIEFVAFKFKMDCKLHISLVLTWDPDDSGAQREAQIESSESERPPVLTSLRCNKLHGLAAGPLPPPIQHCQLNLVPAPGPEAPQYDFRHIPQNQQVPMGMEVKMGLSTATFCQGSQPGVVHLVKVSMSALPHDSAASAPPDLSQGQGQNYNINYYKLYADSVICHLKLIEFVAFKFKTCRKQD
ncbi:hypothetical protein E2320_016708 [Naja naja]|nr:hypothetical protein E2320_016708 [Naja naja]